MRALPVRSRSPRPLAYGLHFLVFAALVISALLAVGRGGPEVSIQYWRAISLTLLLLGAAAAGPWIVAVWTAHGSLREYRDEIPQLREVAAPAHLASWTA